MAEAPEHSSLARRRLAGFKLHMLAYAAAMVVLVAIHVVIRPEQPWFVLLLVGWGAPLAVHCAYAMGLFGGRNG
jgi:hypothetical protein